MVTAIMNVHDCRSHIRQTARQADYKPFVTDFGHPGQDTGVYLHYKFYA